MKHDIDIKIDSTLHRDISTARLTESGRHIALNAARTANLMVDAVDWIVKKLEQFGGRVFLKPSIRH